MKPKKQTGWQFWIDRGGTFTDIFAKSPDGEMLTHKLLSESPKKYSDSTLEGIHEILRKYKRGSKKINSVSLATTLATNSLLEHTGAPTVLLTTEGFRDALRIGYQNRPDIFAKNLVLPDPFYAHVIEAQERIDATGKILKHLNLEDLRVKLKYAYDIGFKSIAIVFMHSYRYPHHEILAAKCAQDIGFQQISISHQKSPLIKFINRGETSVADAYVSPGLMEYGTALQKKLGNIPIYFMQSNGGLIALEKMQGKDCILSGPAAGVIAAIESSVQVGFEKIISFDMGGTSTDVAHYNGQLERNAVTTIAGTRIQSPMLQVHSIAAGGGSIVHFTQERFQVGPDSAGANPGPACYRQGGPATITDCNLLLGRIQKQYYPEVFGKKGNQSLSERSARDRFKQLTDEIYKHTGELKSLEDIAAGFLKVAINNMANAIKKITIQRGFDITEYALCCFGGAGPQHACAVADELGVKTIIIHPLASILSAKGLSVANLRVLKEKTIDKKFSKRNLLSLVNIFHELEQQAKLELNIPKMKKIVQNSVRLGYKGSDIDIEIRYQDYKKILEEFEDKYLQQFGFLLAVDDLVIKSIFTEVIGELNTEKLDYHKKKHKVAQHSDYCKAFFNNIMQSVPLYQKKNIKVGEIINGPAIIVDDYSTFVIEPNWQASVNIEHYLLLKRSSKKETQKISSHTQPDPVLLEIFYSLFMNAADQMGIVLAKTAYSVNIKERLDFSCAIFDAGGELIANAQHIPVHLGSMQASVKEIIRTYHGKMQEGDSYILNNPYAGGTHLPDVTVINPVFYKGKTLPLFYVAARAHQADIGGITPGSIPALSKHIDEEGVLINHFKLCSKGVLLVEELSRLLLNSPYPVRNLHQNIADIKAQIAANLKGTHELLRILDQYGEKMVILYTQFIKKNAERCVRTVIDKLRTGKFEYQMDNGNTISVKIKIDKKSKTAKIDFTGTSAQQHNNFNAPSSVCEASVLYIFRTLVSEPIPLNQGCFKPLEIILPKNCLLNPHYPAAVVAGNVETSQCIVDTLFGALHVMAASQGTMNNLTFGNEKYQYYETICGGSGAGPGFNGTSAVHTHMTNTLLTDPEILELHFPVLLMEFSIRKNSGGKGRWQGGDGVVRKIQFLESMTAAIVSNRRLIPPYGMAGGQPGKCGKNLLIRQDGSIKILPSVTQFSVKPYEVLIIKTPGGGGYGKW